MIIRDEVLTINGLRTHYRVAGNAKKQVLIFLDGWGAQLTGPKGSDRVIRELAKHFFVISPEASGLLRSEPPKEVWGFPAYAAHLHQLLKTLNLTKPIMMGHSFGGGMALMYAHLYPEDVSELILVNAAIKGRRREWYYKITSFIQFISPVILLPFVPHSVAQSVLLRINGVPGHIVTKENLNDYRVMPSVPPAYIKSIESVEYDKISIPILFVWGIEDTVTPLHWAEMACEQLPQARLITLAGVHGVLYIEPQKVVSMIIDDLDTRD